MMLKHKPACDIICGVEHRINCEECGSTDTFVVNGLCVKCQTEKGGPAGNEFLCPCGCGKVIWKKGRK